MEEESHSSGKDFVTCLKWVKQGIPKHEPIQIKYTKEELKEIIDSTRKNLNELNGQQEPVDIEMDVENQLSSDNTLQSTNLLNNNEDAEIIDRYGLENYDDDESDEDEGRNIIGGFGNLAKHDCNENDPYLQAEDSEDEEEEAEDFNLNPDDNLLLIGRVQDDASSLEVHVYNKEDNYIHHDIYLPAFPMCVETINFNDKEKCKCNWAAVGDMTKDINIYDLDVVNELEPLTKLKGHKDAVLDISWSSKFPNILASGSVDKTIHVWDLNVGKSIFHLKRFNNRVQSLEFNSLSDACQLIVGDCDGKITLLDCDALNINSYLIENKEIEKVIWNPNSVYNFVASTDKGTIHLFDTRVKNEINCIEAHSNSITDLAFSINNLLLSACANGEIKIWDLTSNNFKFIDTYKETNVGRIFALATNPDLPLTFAVGGDNKRKSVEVIDLTKFDSVKSYLNLEN